MSDQWDETAGDVLGCGELVGLAVDDGECLGVAFAEGDDDAAGVVELGFVCFGDVGSGGGDEDTVVGRVAGVAQGAVGEDQTDGREWAEFGEDGACLVHEFGATFDGDDFCAHVSEDGGLVSGACADLEDPHAGADVEQFGHKGDDVGLADGLAGDGGQCMVAVGPVDGNIGDEAVPGD